MKTTKMPMPVTIYNVAFSDWKSGALWIQAFTVSGVDPLTEAEAKARARKMSVDGWDVRVKTDDPFETIAARAAAVFTSTTVGGPDE